MSHFCFLNACVPLNLLNLLCSLHSTHHFAVALLQQSPGPFFGSRGFLLWGHI